MTHKGLVIAPIVAVAALALTAVGFAIPQQAFAHYHHHNSNEINVDQQINQLNNCTSSAVCDNHATNQADIDR